jgi:geranylgeranyl reductase family protein
MIAVCSPTDPVIVVGAGPAGATAARSLAAGGVAVRLLDRAVFPRNKPCGGGISVRVLTRFPYLAHELPRIATHAVSRLYLEGPDGDSTVVNSDAPAALMIRRVEFDALLVSLAQHAGAELVTGADIVQARQDDDGVTLRARDGRVFRAPIVIAADGVHSVVARRLGINPGWSSAAVALDMMEETPRSALRDVDPSTLWVCYGFDAAGPRPVGGRSAAAQGYAYIFPKRDHVNIGIGYVLSHYRAAVDGAPYDLQRSFVAALRDRGIVAGDSVRKNFTPFMIPVGGPLRDPGRGRVLVAGDAGGFVNGFTAEGIYYAMVSGELAAKVAAAGGAVADLAVRYRRACDHEVGAELRDSVLIQRYLFADRRRIAAMINGAHRAVPATRAILEFVIGRRSYRSLRRSLLTRSPSLAGRLVWERLRKNFVPARAPRSRI